ncbi:hypothetical protein ACO0LM_22290 [Undibacterium sp. Di26W]|uniref:hypothetical protein n=1 Tax=Undibacterium sp. Di26W TaxID=3413035 RepID=UPI003BEF8214
MNAYITESMQWCGISIEVRYCAEWTRTYRKIYGYALAHLEIRSARALPITATGYLSKFERTDNVEIEGGPVAYIRAWLDHAVPKPETYIRQLSLFDTE